MARLGGLLSSEMVVDEATLPTNYCMRGLLSARPAAANAGRLYWITDAGQENWSRDNGTTWDLLSPSGSGGGTKESHVTLVALATEVTF